MAMGDADSVLRRGIADRRFAGAAAQVLIGEDVVHRRIIGDAVSVGERVSLWEGARFDIASLTKVVGTTAALMSLVSSRQVAVDDPLDRYVQSPHAGITLRHLLTHRAGLAEWQPLYLASEGRASAAALVSELPLRYAVGEGRHYSDLGMILLGRVVEEATGLRLDAAVTTLVAQPLGLEHTAYGPVEPALAVACGHGDDIEQAMIREGEPYPVTIEVSRSAPWRSGINRGEVSDGNAFHAMESVSGHAGLFSTLDDLGRFGATLFDESPIASRSTLDEFLDPGPEGQALGWWWRELDGGPAFVHSGFTGCRLLVDRRRRLVAVLLTNRLHVMEPGVRLGPDIQPLWDGYLAATGVLTS
jgi:CubicO group peptidase (beta-lactamase class C family)